MITNLNESFNYDTKLIAKYLKAKFDDEAFGTAYTMHRISDADAYMARNKLTYNRKKNTIDLMGDTPEEDTPIYKVRPQYSSKKVQGTYAPKLPKIIPIDEYNSMYGESYKREAVHTDLVDQFFADVQNVVDYFRYHNKNLNKTQDYLLYDLEDALDSRSTIATREAIANLKNHSKGMTNAQSSMIEELYGELFAGGEYKDLGRPSYDESYEKEANRNHYPKYVTRDGYRGTFNRLDPGVDGEKIPIYRFPGGESVVDDIELDNGYDLPNADNDAWKLYADGCKPKKKSKRKQMLTQRKGCVDSCGGKRKSEALHGDLVNQIYSVMMNYEYGYDPDMSDIDAMLQELVITNGINDIKSNAFKKAWISAHNKAERKVWGSSGDAMRYDSLTPKEQDAIDDFDEEYWKRWRK